MGLVRPVPAAVKTAIRDGLGRVAVLMLVAVSAVLFFAPEAMAGARPSNLETYAIDVGDKTNSLVDILNYIAFIMGAVLIGLGIGDFRRYVENPGNVPIRQPIIRLGTGGLFLAFPWIAGVVMGTMDDFSFFEIIKMNAYTFNNTANNPNSISGLIANGINNAGVFVNIAAFCAFIIATFFVVRGIQMVRAHVENPGNAPLPEGLKRLAVGGALFSLPMIVNVVYKTFGAMGSALGNSGWSSNTGTSGGLDGMMINFMRDITNPAFFAIEMFCYIAGILMVLFAMQRLVRTAQDGPRGPLGFGTITMFIVAGLLLSFPQMLSAVDASLFTGGVARTRVEFMALSQAGVDAAQIQNAKNVFSAVLAFMAVIGFLSVVRGLFLLKGFADGNQQATMMSVVTHIIAGSLCINLGSFINAVQTSLGVTSFPVTFS